VKAKKNQNSIERKREQGRLLAEVAWWARGLQPINDAIALAKAATEKTGHVYYVPTGRTAAEWVGLKISPGPAVEPVGTEDAPLPIGDLHSLAESGFVFVPAWDKSKAAELGFGAGSDLPIRRLRLIAP